MRAHKYKRGFVHAYKRWTAHGELPIFHSPPPVEDQMPYSSQNDTNFFGIGMHLFDNLNPTQRMVFDLNHVLTIHIYDFLLI